MSSVFPNVSVLSRCHPPLLLPGCGGSAPCDLAAHECSPTPNKLGGESELLIGSCMVAPFFESEQLVSHARTSNLTSKPVSPICTCVTLSVYARLPHDGAVGVLWGWNGARHGYSGLPRRLIAAGARHERRFASVVQSDAIGVAKVVFVAQL